MTEKNAHIIVVSNEKGGTGKSTISMHLAIKLMQEGFRVAVVDTDGRQGTLSRYVENRRKFCQESGINLITPQLLTVSPVTDYTRIEPHTAEVALLIENMQKQYDALIIDTPGNKNYLFDLAHRFADTLITPMSDSLIDLNVLAEIDGSKPDSKKIGHYAEFVWEIKKYLAARGKPMLNWIVVGNKVSPYNSRNKAQVFEYLQNLAKLYGFRVAPGIKDRVIYRELFLQGLTVLDLNCESLKHKMSLSHLAAKQEIKNLAEFICPEA